MVPGTVVAYHKVGFENNKSSQILAVAQFFSELPLSLFASRNMASSISVSYGVTKMYGNMKMQKSSIPAETKNCLSDGRRRRAQRPW